LHPLRIGLPGRDVERADAEERPNIGHRAGEMGSQKNHEADFLPQHQPPDPLQLRGFQQRIVENVDLRQFGVVHQAEVGRGALDRRIEEILRPDIVDAHRVARRLRRCLWRGRGDRAHQQRQQQQAPPPVH